MREELGFENSLRIQALGQFTKRRDESRRGTLLRHERYSVQFLPLKIPGKHGEDPRRFRLLVLIQRLVDSWRTRSSQCRPFASRLRHRFSRRRRSSCLPAATACAMAKRPFSIWSRTGIASFWGIVHGLHLLLLAVLIQLQDCGERDPSGWMLAPIMGMFSTVLPPPPPPFLPCAEGQAWQPRA